MDRRQFLKSLAAAGAVAMVPINYVKERLGYITITVNRDANTYGVVIDADGEPISKVYNAVKYLTRRGGETQLDIPAKFEGEQIKIISRTSSANYERYIT